MKGLPRLSAAFAVVGIFLASMVFLPDYGYAQSGNGQAIQISPVLVELNVSPGETYNFDLTVTNVSSGTINLNLLVNDFEARDETGVPQILFKEDRASSYSLKSWIRGGQAVTLESNKSTKLPITVTVPENAEPGGHYAVVRFSGAAPELEDSGVALSASVGTLVLARVAGDVKENLETEEIFVEQNGSKRSLVESTPFKLVQRIKNTGNVHLKPKGDLTIKNMFGSIIATVPVNENGGNILPESIRRFEQEYKEGFMFGKYTMEMNLAYGTSGQVLQASQVFWVIPYKIIGLILLVLIILILIIRRGLKSYKKRILSQANRYK